jgi:hypothetical protein
MALLQVAGFFRIVSATTAGVRKKRPDTIKTCGDVLWRIAGAFRMSCSKTSATEANIHELSSGTIYKGAKEAASDGIPNTLIQILQ